MYIAIPDFTARTAPLTAVLEQACPKSGKRTNRSILHIRLLSLCSGPIRVKAFLELQACLRSGVRLANSDPEKVVCVYKDLVHPILLKS